MKKITKTVLAAVLAIIALIPLKAFGINLDSLLDAKIKVEKPYLVINVTSTDCIMCRAGSAQILDYLTGSSYKNKIVVLSDDRNMALYFRQDSELYNGRKIIYDRDLSRALSNGPTCTASLVQDNDVHSFLFKKITKDTLDYFKSVLDRKTAGMVRTDKVADSVFSDVRNLYFGKDYATLINDRFQVGLLYDFRAKTIKYMQPEIGDTTVDAIYANATGYQRGAALSAKKARKMMRMVGMPFFMFNGMNAGENSTLFKLCRVSMDTVIKGTDTNINSGVGNVMYIAKNKGRFDGFNAASYGDPVYFQSVEYKGDTLWIHPEVNYEVANDHIYMTFTDYRRSKDTTMRGMKVTIPTATSIVDFAGYGSGRPAVHAVHPIADYRGAGSPDFFFKIDDKGYPVAVNDNSKAIVFMHDNTKLEFRKLQYSPHEMMERIYDISIVGDKLMFVGITNSNNCVKGVYSISDKHTTITKLNSNTVYENMKINGNDILGCKKDQEKNELLFDRFTF